MPKDTQVLLKPALLGGFQKKAVLSYIFDLNESTQDLKQKLTEQIEELTLSRDTLVQSVRDMESRLAAAQAELSDTNARLAGQSVRSVETDGVVERLNDEIARQAKLLEQKSDEAQRLAAENSELLEQNRVLSRKSSELEEKRSQLEQAASQINSLFVKAQADAENIANKARDEASQITRAAHNQADGIIDQAKAAAQEHLRKSSGSMGDVYKQFGDFCAELGTLQKSIADTMSAMQTKMDDLSRAAAKARKVAPDIPAETPPAFSDFARQEKPAEVVQANPAKLADDILNQYGIRKDDSGFFRLSAEK